MVWRTVVQVALSTALVCPLQFAQDASPKSLGIDWAIERVSYEYYWHGEIGTFEVGRYRGMHLTGDVKAYIPLKDSTQQAPWVAICVGETSRCILIQREAQVSTIHSVSSILDRKEAIRHLLNKSDALGVYNPGKIESAIAHLQAFTIRSIQSLIPDYTSIVTPNLTSDASIRAITSQLSCKTAGKACDRIVVIPKRISTSLTLPLYLSCSCNAGSRSEYVLLAELFGDRLFISATSGVRDQKLKLKYKEKIEAIADQVIKDRQ